MYPAAATAWMWMLRGERILDRDGVLAGGWIGLTAVLLVLAALLKTTPVDALRLRAGQSRALVFGAACLMHAAALALLMPALSEDLVRYRLDGRMWLAGANPYMTTPQQFFAHHEPDAIDATATFPAVHTIYPPTAQAVFAASAAIERALPAVPGGPRTWRALLPGLPWFHRALILRAILSAAALGALWILMMILHDAGRSVWWAVLFGWNPLVLMETAGMGHIDAAGVLLVVAMLRMLQVRRLAMGWVMLVLTAGVKPIVIVLAPFVVLAAPRADRKRAALVIGVGAVLLLGPLALFDGWRQTARNFSRSWEANGSVYELVKATFGHGDEGRNMERAKTAARRVGIIALLVTGIELLRRRAGLAEAGYALMLVILLVSPVVYPWYLMWMLCFVPLLDRSALGWTGLVFGGAVVASYTLWHQPAWMMPGRLLWMEYAPVYAALGFEIVAALSPRVGRAT